MESAAQAEDDGSTAEGEQGDMLTGGQGFDDQMPTTADAMADGLKNMAAKTDPDMAKWSSPVVTHMMPGDKDISQDALLIVPLLVEKSTMPSRKALSTDTVVSKPLLS